MSEFASWQVHDLSLYSSFAMDHTEDTSISASLLIPLDSDHRHTGAFRFIVYGGEVETIPFPVGDIFPAVPDTLQSLFLNLPCATNRLRLPDNSTACPWEDAELLIRNVKLWDKFSYSYNPKHFHVLEKKHIPPKKITPQDPRHGIFK
jgi:hypothetical protein